MRVAELQRRVRVAELQRREAWELIGSPENAHLLVICVYKDLFFDLVSGSA